MAIVIDFKNAIRKAIFSKDDTVNFYFNEILRVQYPYVFFYIPTFSLEKAIDSEYWRKLKFMCVVEYAKDEDSTAAELWEYMDTLADAYKLFDFLDTKLRVESPEFKIVEGVLQMTFDLEFYAKEKDATELMEYLDLTIKQGGKNGTRAT